MTIRKDTARLQGGRGDEWLPYEHPGERVAEEKIPALVARARGQHGNEAREQLIASALTEIQPCADELARDWIDAMDLYQEGALAVIKAVDDFLGSTGEASSFRSAVQHAIRLHLEQFIAGEEKLKLEREQLVRDVELLEQTFVELKRELGREPLIAEVAAKLSWTARKVTVVGETLERAREEFDLEILQYLDPDIAESLVEDIEPGLVQDDANEDDFGENNYYEK